MTAWSIDLYAILSADDCIADTYGKMPRELMNEADWRYFQDELDSCAIIVLGRRSHEAAPNSAGRRRIIMSSSVGGLQSCDGAFWWNTARVSLGRMLADMAPGGGKIGVPGGQQAFDYFLRAGFDRFHLSLAIDVRLPGGPKAFSAPGTVKGQLRQAGLVPGKARAIDTEAKIVLTFWDRNGDKRWQA
jgi:hypothetical protein